MSELTEVEKLAKEAEGFKFPKPTVMDIAGKQGFRSVTYDTGRTYIIKPFKGKQGTRLSFSLGKYVSTAFGGVIAGAVDQVTGGDEDEKLDTIGLALSGILQGAFDDLDDPKFQDFFFELFSNVFVDNQPLNYDDEFVLDQGIPFSLASYIITYNFASVFKRLGIDAFFKKKGQEESANRG